MLSINWALGKKEGDGWGLLELDTPKKCKIPNAPLNIPCQQKLPLSSLSEVISLPLLEDLVMTTPEAAVLQGDLQDQPPAPFVTIDRFKTLFAARGEMQSQIQKKIAYTAKELQNLDNLLLAGTCRTYIGLIWI